MIEQLVIVWEGDLRAFAAVELDDVARTAARELLERARELGRAQHPVEEVVELIAPQLKGLLPLWARDLSKLFVLHRITARAACKAGTS